MIIDCPNCQTKFNLDPNILGDNGKKVKCKNCQETWLQKPLNNKIIEEDNHVIPEDTKTSKEIAKEIIEEQGTSTEPTDQKNIIDSLKLLVIKRQDVSLFLFLILISFLTSVIFSNSIMAKYPESEYFYNKIGIKSPIVGEDVAFQDLVINKVVEKGLSNLMVQFNLVNKTDKKIDYPSIKIYIEDEGEVLKEWSLNAKEGEFLTANLSKEMKMQFANIPENAKKIFIKVKYSNLDKENIKAYTIDKKVKEDE